MKINIKGFTFVGFAAAIFAMNAMAAVTATNTVTSKSYVDAKISSANAIDTESTTTAPNEAAVSAALNGKQDKNNTTTYKVGYNNTWAGMTSAVVEKTGDGAYIDITAGNNGEAVVGLDTSKLTSTYNSETWDTAATAGNLVTQGVIADALEANGGTVNTGVIYVTQNGVDVDNFGVNDADSSTIAILAPDWDSASGQQAILNKPTITNAASDITDAVSTATKQLPTAFAVQQYVDGAIDAMGDAVVGDSAYTSATYDSTTGATTISLMSSSINNSGALASNLNSTTGKDLVTEYTLQETLATKQDTTTAVTHTANSAVGDSSTPVYIDSNGAAQPTSLGTAANSDVSQSGVDSGETGLVTGGDVYTYVQSVTGGNQIPAQNPEVCTTAHPCALVDEAGALNWRTMAQANYDSAGTCGNLNNNCGDQ